jgi:hypothetical protein
MVTSITKYETLPNFSIKEKDWKGVFVVYLMTLLVAHTTWHQIKG